MASSTILVTGAAGFIGSHLTEHLLARGDQVVALDNFCDFYPESIKRRNLETAMPNPRFELVEADIRDRDAVLEVFARYQPHAVVHLAGMPGVRPSLERPAYYTAVNVDGTVNILDGAVAHGASKLLLASSSSIYGNNPKVPFSEEDNVDHPISPYAATKKAAELLCHTYWHIHRLPIFCLRFFTVFGPRQRPDLGISLFLRAVSQGQPLAMYGDGSASRDFTYVDDIVSGLTSALDHCTPQRGYRVYNLGGNHPMSLRDLIATVERVVGKPAKIQPLPMRPGDVDRTWADLTRSTAELGYSPKTSVEEGIARQWEWMKKQG